MFLRNVYGACIRRELERLRGGCGGRTCMGGGMRSDALVSYLRGVGDERSRSSDPVQPLSVHETHSEYLKQGHARLAVVIEP